MRVLALDLALGDIKKKTGTGFATLDEHGVLLPPDTHGRGVRRLQWFRDRIMLIVLQDNINLVAIEGYSYGSANQAHQLGELGGVVRIALTDNQVPWIELQPSTVKKLATGKGNAGKNAMLVTAVKRLGYEGESNDEADALWLLEAAKQHYDLPGRIELPKSHLVALSVVMWPEIKQEVAHGLA